MAAMQAQFEETITKLPEELNTKLRVDKAANKTMREEAAKRKERSLGTSFDGQGGGNSADRRGTAASTMGLMWKRGVSIGGGLGQGLPYVPWDIVPKFPVECPLDEYVAWERPFEVFIANQGLRYTISPDAPEIAVIRCINDAYLFGHVGEALVTDHRRVWGYISEETAGAPFEDCLYECQSVSDALRTVREWSLPLQLAEQHLLVAELEGVQFMGDEDPTFFLARISRLETTMRAVGIEKNESEIVQIILRQLPERYNVVKTMALADPQLTRPRLENTVRSVHSQRKAHEIAKKWPAVGVPAEPSNPPDGMVSRDGGIPRQQEQLQQHWPRDGGMPRQQQLQQHWSRGGGMPRQQQQLQQHCSRDGGMPRQQEQQQHCSHGGGMPRQQQQQQQWSHGGGIPHQHQRSSHIFPPVRQARQQQPLQQPSRGIPTIGGDGEDGSSNMELPMFSLSEGPQQSAPTAVAFAATAPAAEAVTCTSLFPAVSSKGVTETPTSSMGVALAAVPTAAPLPGGTAAPDASVERAARQLTLEKSSAGTASSDAVAEAAPLTADTAALDASVERVARKLTLKARFSSEICGEREASTHPFDPGTVFPLEVRYYIGSWLQHGSSSSSKSNSSSNSNSNDNTSNHDSWWDATCVGALLRPFDPGKRCRRNARIGKAVLDLDLPFDRGKAWRRMQHGG